MEKGGGRGFGGGGGVERRFESKERRAKGSGVEGVGTAKGLLV